MRAHQLNMDGLITNTVVVDESMISQSCVDASIGGGIGDSIVGGVLVKAPPPLSSTFQYQAAAYLDEVRVLREKVLARLNGYGATLYLKEPPALQEEKQNCADLIQGLLDITTIPAVVAAANIAELQVAVKTEYARLVGTASTELLKAFRKVDV